MARLSREWTIAKNQGKKGAIQPLCHSLYTTNKTHLTLFVRDCTVSSNLGSTEICQYQLRMKEICS